MNSVRGRGLWFTIVNGYVRFSHWQPLLPILVLGALTWFMSGLSAKLRIDTDLRVLLPKETPSVVALQEAEHRMGSTDFFTIAFEAASPEAVGRFQKAIADSVAKWKETVWVQYDQDRSFFERHALLYMPDSQLYDLRDRINGMIGKGFTKANPLLMDLDSDAPKPSLRGWPNPEALRRQGLPKDLVDALLEKVGQRSTADTAAASAATAATPAGPCPAGQGPVALSPIRPDSLKNRLMGWHAEKKLWVGVILTQLNRPSTDAIFAKGIFDRGTALIESMQPKQNFSPDFHAAVAGAYRNFSEINQVSSDIITAGLISFALMVVLLWFFVRKAVNLILINIPLFVAMSWTAGVTYLVYHRLTLLTAFILALILGLGIEYTVHLYSRWAEESRKGLDPLSAMVEAMASTGRSLLSGAATNVFSMLALQAGHFKGFNEFGVVVSIGITFALLTTWLVIPPVFFVFTKMAGWIQARPGLRWMHRVVDWMLPGPGAVEGGLLLPSLPYLRPKPLKMVAIGALVFTGILCFTPNLKFENDFENLRGKSTSSGISYGRAVGAGRNTSPCIILGKSEAQMRSVHDSLAARYGNPTDSMMKSYATVQSFVPPPAEQEKRLAVLADIRTSLDARALERVNASSRADLDLLRTYLAPGRFGFDSLPQWAQRFLSEANGDHGKFGYLYGELRESDAVESGKFQDRFQYVASAQGPVMVASSGFIYADVVRMVKGDGFRLGIITFLLLIVITWIDMRNWRGVLITCGFIALSAFWTFKVMGLLGLRLGMYNLVVLPTILSVSVDSVIHLYHRRMELGAGKIPELFRTTGSAVLTGTLNNAFGFVGLCFVSHKGMQTIGFLATLGIGAGIVVMFTLLPWALEKLCPVEPQVE